MPQLRRGIIKEILAITSSVIIGAIGSLLATYVLRLKTSFLEFIPRKLSGLTVISSFQGFYANSPGDRYNNVLWIRIRNTGAHVLYVARAVYFRDRAGKVPIYVNASISQKYRKGFEAKFGEGWYQHHTLIKPGQEATTYLPLGTTISDEKIPVRKRGFLLIEYVYDGKVGKHKVVL